MPEVCAIGENAVWQAALPAGLVLGQLGLDLVLEVNAGHLGEAQKVDGYVCQFFADVFMVLAPGVEGFG